MRGARGFALAIFVVTALALGLASFVGLQAASAGASSFNIGPSPVTVGTSVTYTFTIRNLSDDPQATQSVELTTIQGYPACNEIDSGSPDNAPCDSAVDQNPGVFTPAPTGTGVAGTACGGTTFNVIEAGSGLWTFVPTGAGAPVVLGPTSLGASNPLTTCTIQGTVGVDALPAADANLGLPGIQTRQLSYARGFTSVTADEFTGTGATSVTLQAPPTPPDIKVTKVGNGSIKAGANAVFTIVVTNIGPGTATGVTLNDPLPPTAGVWTVGGTNAASCTVLGDLLTCNFGDLTEGASRTITVTSPTVVADCGALRNTVTVAATNEGPNLANNTASATIAVTCDSKPRMTGGGSVVAPGDVTHGFELHCDALDKPNNLEINWGKGARKYRFHLEELRTAVCTDTGIRQAPPAAPFDTFVGTGTGRFGEVPGTAKLGYSIEFTLTDGGPARGEPGLDDTATFKIYETANPANVVLSATGKVTRGNHQAHK